MTNEVNKELSRFERKDVNAWQQAKMGSITEIGKNMAHYILEHVPNCADRTSAIRYLRLAVMQANAAIVHEGN